MNLVAQRTAYRPDGIFSAVADADADGDPFMVTLEHAYATVQGWQPKIPPGFYTCVRGQHQLAGMAEPFETFEITGVEGHTNLLFHAGNFDADSEGCMLCGEAVVTEGNPSGTPDGAMTNGNPCGIEMVTNSRATFAKFMGLQSGLDSFQLEVRA